MAQPLIRIIAGYYFAPDDFSYNRAYSFNASNIAKVDGLPVTIADLDETTLFVLFHYLDGFLIPVLLIPFYVSMTILVAMYSNLVS